METGPRTTHLDWAVEIPAGTIRLRIEASAHLSDEDRKFIRTLTDAVHAFERGEFSDKTKG